MKGFTLIEMMIVVAIIGILLAVLLPILMGKGDFLDGSRCIGGYKHTFSEPPRQIFDEQGKGIPCSKG